MKVLPAVTAMLFFAMPAMADSRSQDLATPLPPIQTPPNHFFVVPTSPAGGVMGSAQYNTPKISIGGRINVGPTGNTDGGVVVTFPNPLSR